jgi:hypothetical protein
MKEGNMIRPSRQWDGRPDSIEFEFEVITDSELSSDPENRHCVAGSIVKMNGAVISCKSNMHKTTDLSITEGEFVEVVSGVQDALYGQQVVESLGPISVTFSPLAGDYAGPMQSRYNTEQPNAYYYLPQSYMSLVRQVVQHTVAPQWHLRGS